MEFCMISGDKIDRLIGEKLFGHKVVEKRWGKEKQYRSLSIGEPDYFYTSDEPGGFLSNPLPSYSSDIDAAWKVVEKLTQDSWIVRTISSENGGTDCVVECGVGARGKFSSDTMEGLETTAPHAICLAALKAVKAYE
jgi:hypothetical protein